LSLSPPCLVLEVGCGAGDLWLANRHRLRLDGHLIRSLRGMLAAAYRQLRPYGHTFQFAVLDAQALPFADGCFDAIIANHMLYHVPNRPAAYAEFCRVLQPRGKLYAATNSRDTMRELDELVRRFRCDPAQERGAARPMNDSRLPQGFNLEHGAVGLSHWFAAVTLHRYTDVLVVPEAEPLVAYVRSTGRLTENELVRFQHHIEEVIAQQGPIWISKDVGMFEASQPIAS
ncbi:MAG: class I SAM-dependent methyltransferase, partial [Armatimonadota bacterium]|nr:class I SAM-dependent methyltransferase [Armatimonadota bacterium]